MNSDRRYLIMRKKTGIIIDSSNYRCSNIYLFIQIYVYKTFGAYWFEYICIHWFEDDKKADDSDWNCPEINSVLHADIAQTNVFKQ